MYKILTPLQRSEIAMEVQDTQSVMPILDRACEEYANNLISYSLCLATVSYAQFMWREYLAEGRFNNQ